MLLLGNGQRRNPGPSQGRMAKDKRQCLFRDAIFTTARATAQTKEELSDLPKPFDIVLLGMGTDGHTASLFPDSKDIENALSEDNGSVCQPIDRGEGETLRMTMTLNALLNAKEIKLFFFGDEKLDVYNTAKAEKNICHPVSYILHQDKVPVTLYWTGA